jgi:hypothetical protein
MELRRSERAYLSQKLRPPLLAGAVSVTTRSNSRLAECAHLPALRAVDDALPGEWVELRYVHL